jgi:4-hydroxy-3-methylbut-2-enyl diphosphate reductase
LIEIAEVCGFCAGAKNAFDKALEAAKNSPPGKRVVLFKQLLHNQDVVDIMKSYGVLQINNKEDIKNEHIAIIRAHGETKDTLKYLDDHGFSYIDGTCAKVKRIHTAIEKKYNDGYKIFIIGENKTHPEVIGSHSWCGNEGSVITAEEDIESIDLSNEKIFVAAQTTLARDKFNRLSEKIKSKFTACHIEIMDSLCNLQEQIQNVSVALAKDCGTMIVIGDKNSANTRELYNKCKGVCSDIRWIETEKKFYEEIVQGNFDFSMKIGITGGASAPVKIIEKCRQLLMFKQFYETTRKKIAEKIRLYDQALLQNNNPFFQDAIGQFAAIGESEKAKFIRGSLIVLGYKMAQGQNEDYSLDLAAAYELFETSILVHDDVFDKADKRRDTMTVHKKIVEKYSAGGKGASELVRFNAQSIAICTGDLGFYFVNQIILDAYKNDKNLFPVLKYYNDVVIKTIKGELLDIVLPLEEQLRIPHGKNIEDCVFEIDRTKTAEYSAIGPFCLGLTLGGMDQSDLEKYKEMLACLGIAFQIKDDYLNIYGQEEQGKPLGNDISEYKMTLFYSEVCKNEKYKKELLKYYGKEKLSKNDFTAVKNIFAQSGAKKRVEEVMAEYFGKCGSLLGDISFRNEEDRDILSGFISYLELRSR